MTGLSASFVAIEIVAVLEGTEYGSCAASVSAVTRRP
jgi:hypothetical protein